MITVETRTCTMCGKKSYMELDEQKVRKWKNGMFVQDAFPELSKEEREMLITGTHPACWNELFADDEEGEI